MNDRLQKQIEFILEVDKAKQVLRRNYLTCGTRRENDAEHMWHLTLMAMTLAEWANESRSLVLMRVLRMLIVHDLVEIDAGDTFAYDADGELDRVARERIAAKRIFGLLPEDQRDEYRGLWEEFEARETPEARFAAAVDRLAPVLMNVQSGGRLYRENGITPERILARVANIREGSETLWEFVQRWVGEAETRRIFETE